ncbi:unnamed protein product [Discosporangium mesarthrocarpum]
MSLARFLHGLRWESSAAKTLARPFACIDKVSSNLPRYTLGKDATLVATEPNAGGHSVVSEALSMEYLARRFGARDVITEMAINYWSFNWKKVDFICTLQGHRIGVSVTRAMGYPSPFEFNSTDAERLLHKKLHGLIVARSGISEEQRHLKSILHCWCQDGRIARLMLEAFESMNDDTITENVAVLLTIAVELPSIFTDDEQVLVRGNFPT